MKKIILGIVFVLFALVANSQELVKTTRNISNGESYLLWTCAAVDSVGGLQDSVLFTIKVAADMPFKFDVGVSVEKKTGSDTSVHVCAYGALFANGPWARIGTGGARSANVTSATNTFVTFSYGTAVQYRYIRVHVQKPANLTGSTGVKINTVELKVWEQ